MKAANLSCHYIHRSRVLNAESHAVFLCLPPYAKVSSRMTRKMEVVSTITHPVPNTRVSGFRPERAAASVPRRHAPILR